MTRLFLLALALLAIGSALPVAASSAFSMSSVGVGPHGWDWIIGTWSCTNSMPSPMGGPATTTVAIARVTGGSLSIHITGSNFEASGYTAYDAKTKTWWNPSAFATGDSSNESSIQTGKTTLWSGTFQSAATGKTNPIRDTYTVASATRFTDLSQAELGGTWKTIAKSTCTKS